LKKPDKIILLSCLKTHKYAQFTGALKTAVAFMKPIEELVFISLLFKKK